MPNIFILAATKHLPFEKLRKCPDEIRKVVVESGGIERIMRITFDCREAAQNINLPPAYKFLKSLTQTYADALINMLTKLLEQRGDNDDYKNKYHSSILALRSM